MAAVFLTGAGGCVGHYLVDALSPDHELYLLVRNPARLRFDPTTRPNLRLLVGDLDAIADQSGILGRIDYCIHAATAWGGQDAERINVHRTHEMFRLLHPGIRRVIYFSTASILGPGNRPLPEAETYGTDYIRSKYRCYASLPESPVYDRTVTVFPTLVFGGDERHPYSHLSKGLPILRRNIGWLRRLNVEIPFHFIHARDIALIVRHLLAAPHAKKEYVLGNEAITFGGFMKEAASFFGRPVRRQIRISPAFLYGLARLAGAKMSAWDRFCLALGDFRYDVVNCSALGLADDLGTVANILRDFFASSEC